MVGARRWKEDFDSSDFFLVLLISGTRKGFGSVKRIMRSVQAVKYLLPEGMHKKTT
jgi:hypothetical protein